MRCDDEHITGVPLAFDVDATDLAFIASSGNDVVVHARQTGTYRSGLPKAPPGGWTRDLLNGSVRAALPDLPDLETESYEPGDVMIHSPL